MPLMTQVQFAKHMGVSQPRIAYLKKKGKIVMIGKLIDVEPSIRDIGASRAIADIEQGVFDRKEILPQKIPTKNNLIVLDANKVIDLNNTDDKGLSLNEIGMKAKASETQYKALNEKVKYDENIGSLVSLESMQNEAFDTGKMVKDSLLNIAPRISSILATETDQFKIHNIIDEEIRAVLLNLSRSIDDINKTEHLN